MKCVHFSEVCAMKVKTLDSFSSHMLKSSVKRATKNVQLVSFFNIAAKRVE